MSQGYDHDCVIVTACRTAIGAFLGGLSEIPATTLGGIAVAEVIKRSGIPHSLIDEVIVGSVLTGGGGQGIARQVALGAGLPTSTPAFSIDKVCGSSLKAVVLGAQGIRCADADVVVACGTESMSRAAYVIRGVRKGLRMGSTELVDTMVSDGLTDTFGNIHMGITAENVSQRYQISRAEQDRFACWSQAKADSAIQTGRFSDEIVSVQTLIVSAEVRVMA